MNLFFVKICIQMFMYKCFKRAWKNTHKSTSCGCLWKAILGEDHEGPMRNNFYFLLYTFKFLTLGIYYFYNFLKVKKCKF